MAFLVRLNFKCNVGAVHLYNTFIQKSKCKFYKHLKMKILIWIQFGLWIRIQDSKDDHRIKK
jgi:hypothetical protein